MISSWNIVKSFPLQKTNAFKKTSSVQRVVKFTDDGIVCNFWVLTLLPADNRRNVSIER